GFLDPQEFSFFLSIQFITIIILGGLASLLGSVLGAAFLIILPEALAGLDVWQALVYGLIMVLTIIFMPFGLTGAIRRSACCCFRAGLWRTLSPGRGPSRAGPRDTGVLTRAAGRGTTRARARDGEQSLPRLCVLYQDGADGTVLRGLQDLCLRLAGGVDRFRL